MSYPVVLIESESDLHRRMEALIAGGAGEVALDIEGEYNLHRYGMHLCLVQLFDGKECLLVDTVKIKNISCMRPFFEGDIDKVVFSPANDLILLDHLFGFHLKHIFDVQSAARLLGHERLSLGTIISEELGVTLDKSKTKQKSNWNFRPLKKSLLNYAADDVLYLLDLKRKLLPEIERRGLADELARINADFELVRYAPQERPYLNLRDAKKLTRIEKVYLKHFFYARDEIARKVDLAPSSVLSNASVIEISKRAPGGRDEWKRLGGLNRRALPHLDILVRAKEEADAAAEQMAKQARAAGKPQGAK